MIPGTYTVSLAKRVDGVETAVGTPQRFEVYPLDQHAPRPPQVLAFQQKTAKLQRAVLGANAALGEAMNRIDLLEQALERTPGSNGDLHDQLRTLQHEVRAIQWSLSGDPTVRRRREATPPSIMQRLGRITGGAWSGSLTEVTGMQREQYDIIAAEFDDILERTRVAVELNLKRIEDAAEEAGAPWTSGRLPTWRP